MVKKAEKKETVKKTSPKQTDKVVDQREEVKVEKVIEVKTDETSKEIIVKEEKQEEVKVEEVFVTFCGSPFDSAQNSDCFMECKVATPEQYERCVGHFKTVVVVKKAEKKVRVAGATKSGFNSWKHLIGSQAELIDRCLLTSVEGPVTMQGIADYAKAAKHRTRHHVKHLQKDFGVKIYINIEKKLFIGERFPELITIEGTVEFV